MERYLLTISIKDEKNDSVYWIKHNNILLYVLKTLKHKTKCPAINTATTNSMKNGYA